MDDMLNNIVMMKNHGQAQLAGATTSPSTLDEIRDLAVVKISEAFSRVLENTASELFDLASKNPSHVMYCLYMDTREQIQAQRDALVSAFRRQWFQRFNQTRRRGYLGQPESPNLNASEFNLVEPEELELTLASNTISHALRLACSDELPGLERRLGLLLEDPELRLGPNPLGPEIIGETLMDAIKTLPAGNKIKLLLVTRLNTHLPTHIKHVYEEINHLLVKRGVLPTIRIELKRAQAQPAPTSVSEDRDGEPETPQRGIKPQGDMFAMLQQLMAMGRIGAGPSLPPLPGSGGIEAANEGEIETTQVMQRLTRIQHGELSNLPGGNLDPGVLASGQVNVLRAIKNTGVAGSMGHMDAMTLDIVALMFDYILDDARLPDGMKALIGRLQIPVLKVAMLDKNFFSHKAHPARKLLDTLADAALGWNEQEGHDSPFYNAVDGLVQRVLNEFEDNVDVFKDVLEKLQVFIAEEKRQADERTCHSAQILQSTEQAALARTLALEALQARLLDSDAPGFILLFLQGPWVVHLSSLYLRDGASGKGWAEGLSTIDDLLWSLTPKVTKEERQKLVTLLPNLLKQLDTGIQAAGQSQEERDRFFTNLVKYHSEAVKAGWQGHTTAQHAEELRPEFNFAPSSDPYVFDTPDFHDIPSPARDLETDPRILREISATPDPSADAEEIVIGDVIGQDQLTLEGNGDEGHTEKLVRQLKRGTWIEFMLDDKSTLRAKLAWVSPLRGTYLFTNRLGERAVSINAAGLAQKLRDGNAKIVDNVALIDRAVSCLFDRLQKSN
jgi:hypothetical protein